ncbi:MarR family transcriptional regulator, partial [Halobium palmae]
MESVLSEIEFLALSANRVRVLDQLAESEYSRRDLAELTGASQPTLGRILHDFEERAWVTRGPEGYAATATG